MRRLPPYLLACAALVTVPAADRADVGPPPSPGLRANLYLLSIGVDAYPRQIRLNYAVKAAKAVAQVLPAKAGPLFNHVETQLLLDGFISVLNASITGFDVHVLIPNILMEQGSLSLAPQVL